MLTFAGHQQLKNKINSKIKYLNNLMEFEK